MVKKVATLVDSGMSQKDIMKELNITHWHLRKITTHDSFKMLLAQIGDEYISNAKRKWLTHCAKLLDKCADVLMQNLDEGDLDAVKIALKSLGIGNEEIKTGDTAINVILPGSSKPKEVASHVFEKDSPS